MRSRDRILQSLDNVFRDAFDSARERDDADEMRRLDLEYQRAQLELEVLLDIRECLVVPEPEDTSSSLLEKARTLKRLTKLR